MKESLNKVVERSVIDLLTPHPSPLPVEGRGRTFERALPVHKLPANARAFILNRRTY
jgi:hypothetical protein